MSAFFHILIKKGKQNLPCFHEQVSIKCLSVFLCFSCIKETAQGYEHSAFTQAHWHLGVSRTCIKFMVNYRHVFLSMLNRRLGTYYQRKLTRPHQGRFTVYFSMDGLCLFVPHFTLQQFKINSTNSIASEEKNYLWFVHPFSHVCSVILFKFEQSHLTPCHRSWIFK